MKIAGIHSGHDCAFAVLNNGKPEIHAELERYTREKEPAGDSLDFLFKNYRCHDDIAHFVHCVDTKEGGIRSRHPDSFEKMLNLCEKNGSKFHIVGHHLAHAAHAFFSSNFDDALIVSIDGGGPEITQELDVMTTTFTVWYGNGLEIKPLYIAPYEKIDIGGFWTHCTKEIFGLSGGHPKGHQAGTVMAMAALGDGKKWKDYFLKTGLKPDFFVHKKERDHYYDAFKNSNESGWWGTVPPGKLNKVKPYITNTIDFKYLQKIASESEQSKFDIAAGIQQATEEIVKSIIDYFIDSMPTRNICLSGGVSLNSVLVGKMYDWYEDRVDGIYVAPVPYDAGLAIGSAQYVWHSILKNDRIKWHDNFSPYLGEIYDEKHVLEAIKKFDVVTEKVEVENIVNLLDSQKIISVFGGGSESGRRALGNRSILADPRSKTMKDLINEKVKHRQWFRPFAPSIMREHVEEWFEKDVDSPYMTCVIKFKEDKREKVPAVVHFDGSARLQTVTVNDNSWYYKLLSLWKEKSGVPILLNTSFNDQEPIVETAENAIACFLKTDIDYLYFYDYNILCKKREK